MSEEYECVSSPCLSERIRDPWEYPFAAIVPRMSGGLSAFSSMLIIYVIMRSRPKLSTIYHRIMFGLSIADVMGSVSIALTSLPMPSYMPREEEFGYYWAGTRIGNTSTCNAQGFFATFGVVSMISYNGSLCIYYFFTLVLNISEIKIKKYFEKLWFHACPITMGLTFAVIPLFYDLYNPALANVSWCFPQPYPFECLTLPLDLQAGSIPCVRGDKDVANYIMTGLGILLVFYLITMIGTFMAIIFKVNRTERILRTVLRNLYGDREEFRRRVESRHASQVILIQSFAYITASLTSLLPLVIRALSRIDVDHRDGFRTFIIFDKVVLMLFPLQGFFNLLIFVSHKVYSRVKSDDEISILKALYNIFFASEPEPCYFSRITLVIARHAQIENQSSRVSVPSEDVIVEVNVDDETGDKMVFQYTGIVEEVSHGLGVSHSSVSLEHDAGESVLPISSLDDTNSPQSTLKARSSQRSSDAFSYPSSNKSRSTAKTEPPKPANTYYRNMP